MKANVIKTATIISNPKAIAYGITCMRIREDAEDERGMISVMSRLVETAEEFLVRAWDAPITDGSGNAYSIDKTEEIEGHTVYYQTLACGAASHSSTLPDGVHWGRWLFAKDASRVDVLSNTVDVGIEQPNGADSFSMDALQIEISDMALHGKRFVIQRTTNDIQTSWFRDNVGIMYMRICGTCVNMVGSIMDFVNSWNTMAYINLNFQRNVTGDLYTFLDALKRKGAKSKTYTIRLGTTAVNYPIGPGTINPNGKYAFSAVFDASGNYTVTPID